MWGGGCRLLVSRCCAGIRQLIAASYDDDLRCCACPLFVRDLLLDSARPEPDTLPPSHPPRLLSQPSS